jgi:hypothetical protein
MYDRAHLSAVYTRFAWVHLICLNRKQKQKRRGRARETTHTRDVSCFFCFDFINQCNTKDNRPSEQIKLKCKCWLTVR